MLIESSSPSIQQPHNYRATVERFLATPALVDFVKTMKTICSGDQNGCPTNNYFALNFNDAGPTSFKIYFAFYKKLQLEEILRVLPTTADIEPFYPLFEESKKRSINHTGLALAIKLDQQLRATYQIHFRFLYSPILPQPKFVKLSNKDYRFTQGISFEYTGAQTLRKNYYYLNGSAAYRAVLARFGGPDRNHLVEYTETEKWSKVIHWFYRNEDIQDYIQSSANSNYQNFIKWAESEYGVMARCPGVYDDQKTRSIYFFSHPPLGTDPQEFFGSTNTINRLPIRNI